MTLFKSVVVTILFGLASFAANASTVLDQSQTTSGSLFASVAGDIQQAQTFTVGVTGTLSQLDFFAIGPADVFVDIRRTVAGVPDDTQVLETVLVSVANSSSYEWVSVSFNTEVLAGEVLAFVVYGASSGLGLGGTTQSNNGGIDPYVGGSLWTKTQSFNSGLWYPNGNSQSSEFDLAFRTYVDEPMGDVPLPSALPLLGAGLLGYGLMSVRRRTA